MVANEMSQVVEHYLTAMERGDLDGVLKCFSEDGVVESPVYGKIPVAPFYEKLFEDTVAVKVDLIRIYVAVNEPRNMIAHFHYRWERRSAPEVDTKLIDVFTLSESGKTIQNLRIIFDHPNT